MIHKYKIVFFIILHILPTWLYAEPININTATAEELDEMLPGIGPTKANTIILYREKHGPFKTLKDLDEVPGIGPKLLEIISELVIFGEATTNPTTETYNPPETLPNPQKP